MSILMQFLVQQAEVKKFELIMDNKYWSCHIPINKGGS